MNQRRNPLHIPNGPLPHEQVGDWLHLNPHPVVISFSGPMKFAPTLLRPFHLSAARRWPCTRPPRRSARCPAHKAFPSPAGAARRRILGRRGARSSRVSLSNGFVEPRVFGSGFSKGKQKEAKQFRGPLVSKTCVQLVEIKCNVPLWYFMLCTCRRNGKYAIFFYLGANKVVGKYLFSNREGAKQHPQTKAEHDLGMLVFGSFERETRNTIPVWGSPS